MTLPATQHPNPHEPVPASGSSPAPAGLVRDPVCGMWVDPAAPRGGSAEHAGHVHHFCSPRCRERFVAAPTRWVRPPDAALPPAALPPAPRAAAGTAAAGTTYVCPMHPEVRSD